MTILMYLKNHVMKQTKCVFYFIWYTKLQLQLTVNSIAYHHPDTVVLVVLLATTYLFHFVLVVLFHFST